MPIGGVGPLSANSSRRPSRLEHPPSKPASAAGGLRIDNLAPSSVAPSAQVTPKREMIPAPAAENSFKNLLQEYEDEGKENEEGDQESQSSEDFTGHEVWDDPQAKKRRS